MVRVPQKPRVVTGHDIMEGNLLLPFKHPEELSRQFNSLLPDLAS
jgi:hypothetical protein